MKVRFLGTGTSYGIPVPGCSCLVCSSPDPHNKRLRSSLLLSHGGSHIVVDTTPEFRLQVLAAHLSHLSGVLFTHSHADHIHGIDDVRPFSCRKPVAFYANETTSKELLQRFAYVFSELYVGQEGLPRAILNTVREDPFTIGPFSVTPIPIWHGKQSILAYRIGDTAYLTDCNAIPKESLSKLENLETLVVGALRYKPHPTHFTISEAKEIVLQLAPRRAYLTHMCHEVDHGQLARSLPRRIVPAYDGLTIETK